ncbi:MAG: IclR family transcriptional regulator [Yangia sp.]|nr:IclR family transcriptional regulator [Salipiger sp.]
MKDARSSSNAERALEILLILGDATAEGFSLAQISERLGCAKSVAHRSLSALRAKGFAETAGRYGHYRLGPSIPALTKRQDRLEPQARKLRPGMTEFARHSGLTVYLILQAGLDAVCGEMISRSSRRHFTMGVGARIPMGVQAGSVALLSLQDDEAVSRVLDANAHRLPVFPACQKVDREVVAAQVADARLRGFAVNMGYYLPGEGGLGLPIPAQGAYEADVAVSFTAPIELMSEEWMVRTIDELRGFLAVGAG